MIAASKTLKKAMKVSRRKRKAESLMKLRAREIYLILGILLMFTGMMFMLMAILEEGAKHFF